MHLPVLGSGSGLALRRALGGHGRLILHTLLQPHWSP